MITADRARDLIKLAMVQHAQKYLDDVIELAIAESIRKMEHVCCIKIGDVQIEYRDQALPSIVETPIITLVMQELRNLSYNVTVGYFGDMYENAIDHETYIDFGYIISWME